VELNFAGFEGRTHLLISQKLMSLNEYGSFLCPVSFERCNMGAFLRDHYRARLEDMCVRGMEGTPQFERVKARYIVFSESKVEMSEEFIRDMETGGYAPPVTQAIKRLNDVTQRWEAMYAETRPPPVKRQRAQSSFTSPGDASSPPPVPQQSE
jgi:hypothetical protein